MATNADTTPNSIGCPGQGRFDELQEVLHRPNGLIHSSFSQMSPDPDGRQWTSAVTAITPNMFVHIGVSNFAAYTGANRT